MLTSIRSALGIFNRLSEQYEYWKEYKGQEIWIRSHNLERPVPHSDRTTGGHRQTSYVIVGTVEDVMSFPPGFLLKDVKELIVQSDFSLLFAAGATESQGIVEGGEAQEVIREIDRKFVSFDSIDQLERRGWVESSDEPYREEGGLKPSDLEKKDVG